MTFDWLNRFQHDQEKTPDYAAKTLAAYRLGMKARGAIAGVRLAIDPSCCPACLALAGDTIYHPDDAPLLPPDACPNGRRCRCVYRPVMTYELDDDANAGDADTG